MPLPKDPIKAQLWRERQRQAQLGKSRNKGESNPFYGKRHTNKTKLLMSQALSGENNPNFGKPSPQNTKDAVSKAHKGVIPAFKGKHHTKEVRQQISEFNKGKKYRIGKHLTYEQRQNISNGTKVHTLKGKDHPRWKGGISPENQRARYSFRMKEWRHNVFERDHYICQQCGYTKGKILIAHHIKYFSQFPELRFDVNNGITLCRNCHGLIHSV